VVPAWPAVLSVALQDWDNLALWREVEEAGVEAEEVVAAEEAEVAAGEEVAAVSDCSDCLSM
jgi:hypothetical protein